MLRTINKRKVRLENALDVDLKITRFAKFPNPPNDNEKRQKQVRFNEKGNLFYDSGENNSD